MKNLIFLSVLGIVCCSCNLNNPEIYEWRGPDRNGIYPETGLLKVWPSGGPEELWFTEGIGKGYGSPVITGERIYLTGAIDSTAYLHCLTMEGKSIWEKPFGKEWVINFPGSRSAPTVVDDLIYVGSGLGNLYCFDKASGNVVWSTDLAVDFQGVLPRFGHSEAAVVDGDLVFWTAGGPEHNVVALDRFTGELVWSSPGHGERSGYNPSRVIALPKRKILVTFSAYHLMGFDAETGKLLWSHEQDNYPPEKRQPGVGDTHSNTVIYEDGHIYYAAGDGNCGVKLELSDNGSEIAEVWRNRDFDSYMGGIVKIGNYLYGCGTASPGLKSINATTGILEDTLKIGTGAVIEADQMLYYYNFRGEMKLVSYSEGNLEEVSSFRITRGSQEHFSHPVIHQGVLYQRHGDVLMAFDISFS